MTISEFILPPLSSAPGLAREGVMTAVGDAHPGVADDIVLLTSEIVTNAVRHAASDRAGDVLVRVEARPDCVRVEVLNPGPSFDPPMRRAPDGSGTRLGLFLVDELSDEWGVDREGERTRVWFEIRARG